MSDDLDSSRFWRNFVGDGRYAVSFLAGLVAASAVSLAWFVKDHETILLAAGGVGLTALGVVHSTLVMRARMKTIQEREALSAAWTKEQAQKLDTVFVSLRRAVWQVKAKRATVVLVFYTPSPLGKRLSSAQVLADGTVAPFAISLSPTGTNSVHLADAKGASSIVLDACVPKQVEFTTHGELPQLNTGEGSRIIEIDVAIKAGEVDAFGCQGQMEVSWT
jgi:hypothetical protein